MPDDADLHHCCHSVLHDVVSNPYSLIVTAVCVMTAITKLLTYMSHHCLFACYTVIIVWHYGILYMYIVFTFKESQI